MTRKEFIKICSLLGIALPFQSLMTSCNKEDMEPTNFTGSVLIVGAGAAGMVAGYLLAQKGIEYRIVEASLIFGGRMKTTESFVDFPIPLGAEWFHSSISELTSIFEDNTVISTLFKAYQSTDQIGYYKDGELSFANLSEEFGDDFIDQKFMNSSWLDFFKKYILPSIETNISFNIEVVSIDYSDDKVVAIDRNGQSYESDKVILTAPLKVLQEGNIEFMPQLPTSHLNAIKNAPIWGGIKVFLEFSESFYPLFLTFPDSETDTGQRIYYDASYGQNTTHHVLGLVALGEQAIQYQKLEGDDQKEFIINELDQIFNGMASQYFIKHTVQNWDEEPFIHSAYLADVAPDSISKELSDSINGNLYFAGEAYTKDDDWGGVHNAIKSAQDVIDEIV